VDSKRVTRKLRAILSADVAGYSRLMGDDEVATFKTITEYREIFSSIVKQYNGRVVDSPGDNILSEFASVVDAVQCAVEIQKVLKAKNDELPENRRMIFRIGVNLGDVIHEDDRIYGDGVNIAARIESLAEPGGICISGSAYEQIENKLALGYEFFGEHSVKNIKKPVRVYKVPMEPGAQRGKKRQRKKWHWAALVLLVLILAGAAFWYFQSGKEKIEPVSLDKMAFPLPDKPSIAVLPLDNMSGDTSQDYLCDGISEQIIASLSQVPGIFVIARNSSFTFKGKAVKVQQVAEELGVKYVLEGSLQKSGDRLRITVQLIDAITGKHIWAEKYDRQLKDLFALQDEICMQILTALRVKLTEGDQARNFGVGTKNIEAYLKVMKGLILYQTRTREGTIKGIEMLNEAIALDPEYVNAYVLLGWVHLQNGIYGFTKTPANSFKEAFKLAQKAINMDDNSANANALMGALLSEKNPEKAFALGEKALALEPNNADVIAIFAGILRGTKHYEKAISKFKEAIRLNPFPPDWYIEQLLRTYRMAGIYDADAFSTMKRALDLNPDNYNGLAWYSWTLGCAGRYTEAIETSKNAIRLNPKHPYFYQNLLGLNLFLAERYEEAIAQFKEAISKAPNTPAGNLGLIATYVQLGRDDDAFELTERFTKGRPKFSTQKWLDNIHFKNPGDRERFAEAFRKVGLMEKEPGSETSKDDASPPLPDKRSIAVLPFTNMAGDPKEQYLCDGFTEHIITVLAKIPDLSVTARNTMFTYKGKAVDIKELGKKLKVGYVLEGSIQKSGARIRVTAQLIDTATGNHLWAEKYDRNIKDIFELQDEIALKILESLHIKLVGGSGMKPCARATDNVEAYLKFLEAIHYMNLGNIEGFYLARKLCEESIAADPDFGPAYAFEAETYLCELDFCVSKSPKESVSKAYKLAKKALSVNNSCPYSRSTLGRVYAYMGQYKKSMEEMQAAIAMDPNWGDAYVHSTALSTDWNDAIELMEKAFRMNPLPPVWYYAYLGMAYRKAGMYEKAITAFKDGLRKSPGYFYCHLGLAVVYSILSRESEARTEVDELLKINPKYSLECMKPIIQSFKDEAVRNRLIEGLKKAGLPYKEASKVPEKPTIAVLAFDNFSSDKNQEYFSDGISEDLITDLSKISDIFVKSRKSSFAYKGKTIGAQEIAEKLGVRYILEGSVRKAGNRVRINAQLIDANTGHHLWAERYDENIDDIFGIQDKITKKIVAALALKLTPDEQKRIADKGTNNIAAYDALLKARANFNMATVEGYKNAISLFEKAIKLDPNYGAAYAGLAGVYDTLSHLAVNRKQLGMSYQEIRLKEREALNAGLKHNPVAKTHSTNSVMLAFQYCPEEALTEAEKAQMMAPNDPNVLWQLAPAFFVNGKPEVGIKLAKKALELDPACLF
jgi:adenylate cyclase